MSLELGTVVSLKSNGLLLSARHNFLSLGGNESFTTPLMVVVEILYDPKPEIDEETGKKRKNIKGKNKYKCIYFSNKSMKLMENWFHKNELKIYEDDTFLIHQSPELDSIKWGDTVRFKTVDEESGKKKSFNDAAKKKDSKPLLSYTSPALQVIGFAAADKKEPILDAYTGKKKRKKTKKLVKCKFFNFELDKFSEQFFPIECLQKVDVCKSEKRLEEVSEVIKGNHLCIVYLAEKKYFGKPKSAHVLSGRYQLVLWNELGKKNEFLWCDKIDNIELIEANNSNYYPRAKKDGVESTFTSVIKYIEGNKDNLDVLKIVYRNLKEEIISRYINVNQISDEVKIEDKEVFYLNAYCFYRDAKRQFRTDRILSIRTIENEKLKTFLNNLIEK